MSNGSAHIAFQQIGLANILKQYRLRVPPNQREYSWTEREVTRLFQDLAKAISDGEPEYFLGTIVTIPRSDDILEVVDGQQRLATMAILLSEIRNYLHAREPIISESITNSFLTDIDRDRRERVTKLQLNLIDNEYFRELIATPEGKTKTAPTKPSHRLIEDAVTQAMKHIRRILSSFDQKDHGDVLNKWLKFVENGASSILLKVPSDRNAYKMFETLNDRGLRTSQWDLVKNYLFGQSDTRLDEAQSKWTLMRGALDSLDEDETNILFLRHALIAIRGHVKKDDVYDAVQIQAKGAQATLAFLNILESLSTFYVAMFNPEHEQWNTYPDSVRRAIRTLNLFNIKPFRPLMLAVGLRFSEKEAAKAYTTLISWGVRLIVAGSTRTSSVELPLAEAAHSVFSQDITDTAGLEKELLGIVPTDLEFRQAFETATVSKGSLARYYLRSLEMQVKGDSSPFYIPNDEREVINLEHVLPLKPDASWAGEFDEELAHLYVRRLGNMALLLAKQNCDLNNADFAAKRVVYRETPYALTNQIATEARWSPESIAARQVSLAEIAVKTWPL